MAWEALHLDPVFDWILRPALAGLFASAALHKIRDLSDFVRTIADYKIIPRALAPSLALGLIGAEGMISIGLILGLVTAEPGAGLAAAGLLALYTLAIAVNLLRGRKEIDCGCLGPKARRQTLSGWLIVRNAILGSGALLTSLPLSSRSLAVLDSVSILGGLILVTLIFNAANWLASLQPLFPNQESVS